MAFGSGLNVKMISGILTAVIVLIIGYQVLADTGSEIDVAAGNVSATNNASGVCDGGGTCAGEVYPLTTFFKQKGIILLALMAGARPATMPRTKENEKLIPVLSQKRSWGGLFCRILATNVTPAHPRRKPMMVAPILNIRDSARN